MYVAPAKGNMLSHLLSLLIIILFFKGTRILFDALEKHQNETRGWQALKR